MKKSEMARYLAETDTVVELGMFTVERQFKVWMRASKAELESAIERRTDPAWVAEQEKLWTQMQAAR